jgi:hypothetical protein
MSPEEEEAVQAELEALQREAMVGCFIHEFGRELMGSPMYPSHRREKVWLCQTYQSKSPQSPQLPSDRNRRRCLRSGWPWLHKIALYVEREGVKLYSMHFFLRCFSAFRFKSLLTPLLLVQSFNVTISAINSTNDIVNCLLDCLLGIRNRWAPARQHLSRKHGLLVSIQQANEQGDLRQYQTLGRSNIQSQQHHPTLHSQPIYPILPF